MRISMLIVGAIVLVAGLHWVGQGTGYFPWPRNPVMDGQIEWVYFGLAATVAGLIIIGYSVWRSR